MPQGRAGPSGLFHWVLALSYCRHTVLVIGAGLGEWQVYGQPQWLVRLPLVADGQLVDTS